MDCAPTTITSLDVYMLRHPIFPTVVPPKESLILHYSKQTNKQKQKAKTNNCGRCLPGSTFPRWLLLMSLVLFGPTAPT